MRTIETDVYTFDELTPEAQGQAIQNYREWCGYEHVNHWAHEWRESLRGFLRYFSIDPTYVDWQVDGFGGPSYARIYPGEAWRFDGESLSPIREWLGKDCWTAQNCPFTGYCGDETLLDPIREYLSAPDDRTLSELLSDCLQSWALAWEADRQYADSPEAIRETIAANGYEFSESGHIY